MTDYSQCGEQAIILEFFKEQPPIQAGSIECPGLFLDLGAYDGITGSNTYALAKMGWRGLCVEASPFAFQTLVETHKSTFVHCLLGAVSSEKKSPLWFGENLGQQSTCRPDDHIHRQDMAYRFHVLSITPILLDKWMPMNYDFVSIDIEGMELAVLQCASPVLAHCKLLCFEHAIPNKPFDEAYYKKLVDMCARYGLTRIVGRTKANTLIARE